LVSGREQSAYRLANLVKKVRRRMSNAIRVELDPISVSLPVFQIMKRVVSGGDLSQLELAVELELEPAAVCRLVTDLEEQRLVTRRRDPDDKRRVLMTATATGIALLALAQPRVIAGVDALFSRLTHGEQAELCRLLEKLARDDHGQHKKNDGKSRARSDAAAPVTRPARRAQPARRRRTAAARASRA
jgi:DNA-binding MarR family transcriptional regulator